MRDLQKLTQYAARRKRSRRFRGVLTAIAAVVVFCTTYALILPAITLEGQTVYCGFQDHTHTEDCYQLACGKEEFIPHYHSAECRDENGELVCHQEETTIHVHSDKCKVALICTQPEREAHQHSEGCYETQSVLVCGSAEAPGHTHGEGCYQSVNVCGLEETPGHAHGEGCYAEDGSLSCTQEEAAGHIHSEGCFTSGLVCTQDETPGHSHTESCYQAQSVLVCQKEEGEGHTHNDDCYSTFEDFRCGQEGKEAHGHTASCFTLACDAHVHTEECYVKPQEDPTQVTGEEEQTIQEEETIEENEEEIIPEDEEEIIQEDEEVIIPEDEGEAEEPSVRDLLLEIYTEEELQELLEVYPEYTLEDIWTQLNTPATLEEPIGTFNAENSENGEGTESGGGNESGGSTTPAEVDFSQYATKVTLEKQQNNQWVQSDTVNSGDDIKVTIDYSLPDDVLVNGNKTIYYQLPNGIKPNENQSGIVKDNRGENNGKEIGTYTISQDGKITIVFTDDFVNQDGAFTGEIHFEGKAELAAGDQPQTIIFPGTGTKVELLPPAITDSGTDVGVKKSRTTVSTDGSTVTYQIEVTTTKGTPNDLVLNDELTGANFDQNSLKIHKVTSSGTTELHSDQYTATYPATENGVNKMSISGLPKLQDSTESYLITYTVNTVAAANGAVIVNNKAITNTWAYSEDNVEVSKAKISKSGTYQQDSGLIKWDITVNEGGGNIGGWTLTDTLPSDYTYVGHAEIRGQNTQPTSVELNGSSFSYTFPENAEGTYYITYYSTAPAENGASITNTAKFIDPENKEYIATATPTVYKRQESMWKSPEANQSQKISDTSRENVWKVHLNLAEKQFNTYGSFTYIDHILAPTFPVDAQHYGIPNKIGEAIQNSIKFTYYDKNSNTTATGSAADYFNYTISYTDANGATVNGSDAHATNFTINFTPKPEVPNSVIGQSIEFQYPTEVTFENLKAGETIISKNQGLFGDSNPTVEQSYTKTSRLEKGVVIDSNGYTSADWSTEYTSGKTITYRLTLRPDLSENDAITLTDTLPKGVTFGGLTKWTLTSQSNPYYNKGILYGGPNGARFDFTCPGGAQSPMVDTKEENGHTVLTITIPEGYNWPDSANGSITEPNVLRLEYTVTLTDAIWDRDDQYSVVLQNNLMGMNASASHSTEVDRTPPTLAKFGFQLNDKGTAYEGTEGENPVDQMRYRVVINPAARDLDPNSETITLTDTLSGSNFKSASLLIRSLRLYTYSATAPDHLGTLVDDSMYTITLSNENTTSPSFSITFRDEQALVLVYDYLIDKGNYVNSPEITNNVSLQGNTASVGKITLKSNSSGASAEKATIQFYKVDSKDYSNLLDGAEFALSVYDNGEWTAPETVGTENGQLKLEAAIPGGTGAQIQKDKLYRLEETTAPTGYKKGDPTYFAWLWDKTIETLSRPNDVQYNQIHALGKFGGTVNIPNESTSIYVKKVWQDTKGNTVTPVSDQIQLTLIQQTQKLKYNTVNVYCYSDYDGTHQEDSFVPGTNLFQNVTPKTYLVAPNSEFKIEGLYLNEGNGRIVYWKDDGKQTTWDTTTLPISFGNISEDCNIYLWAANRWFEVANVGYTEASEMDKSSQTYPNGGTITLPVRDESGNLTWEYRWENLPASDGNGTSYYYRVEETTTSNGWKVSYSANNGGIQSGNITVINTVPYDDTPKTTLHLEKQWKRYDLTDPNTPTLVDLITDDSFQAVFKLYKRAKGTTEPGTQVGEAITLTNSDWTWTSSPLPRVENGKDLEYYFEEDTISGFYPAVVTKSETGDTITFTNVQIPKTSITVEKQWFISDGTKTEAPNNAVISYSIYRKLRTAERSENDQLVAQGQLGYVKGPAATWKAVHSDLELLDDNGNALDYYVVETAVDGYDTTYDYGAKGASSLTSGIVTIKNTKTPSYELPQTGGTGTGLYTLAGLTLCAGAALGLMKKRKKGGCD